MKSTLILVLFLFILNSCANSKKKVLESGTEYWSQFLTGDTTTLRNEYVVYQKGTDTLIQFTSYYENGFLKSEVILEGEGLREIKFVLDTTGNKLNFGKLKKGSGCVLQYNDDGSGLEKEGCYVNGNREGWWKRYSYTGTIIDSTLYKEGFPQYPPGTNSLDSLLDLFGPMKNNLYH